MKLSHKPKTEIFIKEVSDAFLPLQIILNRFPENIPFFNRQSNHNFDIRYDKELKEYGLQIDNYGLYPCIREITKPGTDMNLLYWF